MAENSPLQQLVTNKEDIGDRLVIVNDYICCNQERFGINFLDWANIYSEPVLLVLQKYLKIDFGFCEFYEPNFENRIKNKIEHTMKYDVWARCSVSGDSVLTTCPGNARLFCKTYVKRGLK